MSEILFKPIGQIKAQFSDADVRAERKDLEGELEVYPQFEPALEGIDGFSHLFLLAYFDRLRPDQIGPLQVKPRRLVNRGFKLDELPSLGVFALDSPTRPNPIGLTLVRLLGREGRFLKVSAWICLTARRSLTSRATGRVIAPKSSVFPIGIKRCRTRRGIFKPTV